MVPLPKPTTAAARQPGRLLPQTALLAEQLVQQRPRLASMSRAAWRSWAISACRSASHVGVRGTAGARSCGSGRIGTGGSG